jgi:hypothetical protein
MLSGVQLDAEGRVVGARATLMVWMVKSPMVSLVFFFYLPFLPVLLFYIRTTVTS